MEKGESPLYIFSMICFQFRNILMVKSCLGIEGGAESGFIAKKLGMHPFVARKAMYQASRFSRRELGAIYRKIFKIDVDVKTGRTNPEVALDLLIASI